MKIFFSTMGILLLLSSCNSVKIKHFEKYEKRPLLSAEIMPTEKEKGKEKLKIIVFSFDNSDIILSKKLGLGNTFAIEIENILLENKNIEILDRKYLDKFQEEVKLSEFLTNSKRKLESADFLITGAFTAVEFNKKFSSIPLIIPVESSIKNNNSKTSLTTPLLYNMSSYSYDSKVDGVLKIYTLPDLKIVETLKFAGSASESESANGSNNVNGRQENDFLVRKASNKAVENLKSTIKNFFTQTSYVLEKKSFKNKVIFKIALGKNDGIVAGNKVVFISKKEETNQITNESVINYNIIAKGYISEKIDNNFAWIIVKNENEEKNIKLGDLVKIIY